MFYLFVRRKTNESNKIFLLLCIKSREIKNRTVESLWFKKSGFLNLTINGKIVKSKISMTLNMNYLSNVAIKI